MLPKTIERIEAISASGLPLDECTACMYFNTRLTYKLEEMKLLHAFFFLLLVFFFFFTFQGSMLVFATSRNERLELYFNVLLIKYIISKINV